MSTYDGWTCVTGGTGYLGQHVVCALLRDGEKVRTTVRDPNRASAFRTVMQNVTGAAAENLSIVPADLTQDDGWTYAMRDCDAVIHTASPFPDRPPKNEDTLITVATSGTLRVLQHAVAAGVKRAVFTSSIVAIVASDPADGRDYHLESDWSDPNHFRADGYTRSKLASERAAWALARGAGLELVTLNPGLIFGPPLSGKGATSVGIIDRVLSGRDVALPDVSMQCVDVRDVALAHIRALRSAKATGERIFLSGDRMSFLSIAQILREAYPLNKITQKRAPDSMIRAAAKFDPFLCNVLPYLGASILVKSEKAKNLLSLEYRDMVGTILDTASVLASVPNDRK